MYSNTPDPEVFNKYLLNKETVTPAIKAHIEKLTLNEDVSKFAFHKVMINSWTASFEVLFDTISDFFQSSLIPVSPLVQDEITTFYTSNIHLILKIIKLDFNFLYERIIVSIQIMYNDKTSVDFFNKYETISDIVSGVVSRRFNDNCDLDLSDLCNDAVFLAKKINFYKLNLLANFKILMLRLAKDTKSINISNNNLRTLPGAVLNFFIKGSLSSINISNNNIKSLDQIFTTELYCYKTNLKKLWLEGNPLCETVDSWTYIKLLKLKFPQLIQLDGITLCEETSMLPPVRNFLINTNRRTKLIIEKFLFIYFTLYDDTQRSKLNNFYKKNATMSVTADVPELPALSHYVKFRQNLVDPRKVTPEVMKMRRAILSNILLWPRTVHLRTTFTVDVLWHDEKSMVLVVDGVYKEVNSGYCFAFRRTFKLILPSHGLYKGQKMLAVNIVQEMLHVRFIPPHKINIIKHPIIMTEQFALFNPDEEDIETIVKIFMEISCLKRPVAENQLQLNNWNLKAALEELVINVKNYRILNTDFMEIDNVDEPDLHSVDIEKVD